MGTNISWDSYPIRKKWDGCDESCSSVDEFKRHLAPADLLSSEVGNCGGWVFWSPETESSSGHDSNFRGRNITEKIINFLMKSMYDWCWIKGNILVQFWAPREVGGRCFLTTVHQPFAVGRSLAKGVSWLRKECMQQYYYVADDEDEQGPLGRVFRNGNPESTPDILLYSTREFPLRDFVVGCGLKHYRALPIFDVQHSGCVGILEFIHGHTYDLSFDHSFLQNLGLRLAHDIKPDRHEITSWKKHQGQVEIRQMLELAVEKVPQLHLAQVWVPCTQCADNATSNFSCMELAESKYMLGFGYDDSQCEFEAACKFHNIQNGQAIVGLALSSTNKWCFCENLREFSISEYPMAHYARRARLSSCFAICVSRKHNGNDPHVFEFFLQPQSRDGASIQSVLYLLLTIMEKKLESFEITAKQDLGVDLYRDQQFKEHIKAIPVEGTFLLPEFRNFFGNLNLGSSRKSDGWIFWAKKEKGLQENRGENSSMPQLKLQETKKILSEMLSILTLGRRSFLIQFWAPKIIGKRSFLSTSEQPFALCDLQKGLCWYRKQCSQHLYRIGDGAKEDELGPPGRVFLNGHAEASPDIRLYSQTEFPFRDNVVKGGVRTYLALPLFTLLDKQCVGVLEFVDFPICWEQICKKLEIYNLRSILIDCHPSTMQIEEGKKQAISEVREMLTLVVQSPQVQVASAFISCGQCAPNNIEISSMEWKWFSTTKSIFVDNDWSMQHFTKCCQFLQVRSRKGIIRKVMESETKLYFCENLCGLSICELPLAHFAQVARLEICFAICLKSSYTGNSLHIIEFFLPRSQKYEYSRTLCFLLSTMEQMLKSFKVASGKQLGEELIREVTELCHEMDNHVIPFESDGIESRSVEDATRNITRFSTAKQLTADNFRDQCNLPPGIENVRDRHEIELDYSKNQTHSSGTEDASNIDQEKERNINANAINVEDEAKNISEVNFEEGNGINKSSTSFHVSYEQLQSQFGKRRKDAAKNLGVSISTFKRKCRDYGIKRWPSNMNYIRNPSLFLAEVAKESVEHVDQYQTSQPSGRELTTPLTQKTMECANTSQAADVVIKAKFKDENFKFEFCVCLGMEKLMEELGKRLNLNTGEFKLKYVDEDDGDLISLKCDEDLHFYVKTMKSIGKRTIPVLVHLISE